MTLQIHTKRLDNGLLALAVPMPQLSTAAVTLSFRAGARQDEISGTAHFLEHMAFQGTERRNARQIAETIENTGGKPNAQTGYETTHYETRLLLAEQLSMATEILADITRFPAFPEREMTNQRRVILDEIRDRKDRPSVHVYELLMQAVFPEQTLGRCIAGNAQTLADITPEVLHTYRTHHYHAGNAIFAVAGGVDAEDVFTLAEQFYGDLPAALTSPSSDLPTPAFTAGEMLEERATEQAHLRIAFPAPHDGHDHLPAAKIFAHCLGRGMTSRLFRKIREEMGLCYGIGAGLSTFFDTGLFMIVTSTTPDKLPKLLPAIAETVRNAAQELTAEEVARAKAQIKTVLFATHESSTALAAYAVRQFFIHGRVPDMEEEVAKIDAVDADALAHFAYTYILSQPPAMAALGPLANLESQAGFAARLTPSNKPKGDTMLMKWEYDNLTEETARAVPIINCEEPKPQYAEPLRVSNEWQKHLLSWDDSLDKAEATPTTIIEQFENKHYLKGLVFVVRWGGMTRTKDKYVYTSPNEEIHSALEFCAESLKDTCRIDESWQRLTGHEKGQLSWSPVMASKTLHFLSRAVSFEQNPPVPIDGDVLFDKVWPHWEKKLADSKLTIPHDWKSSGDGGLAGYLRYMTAICIWAGQKGWTTTQIEATIYAEYRKK